MGQSIRPYHWLYAIFCRGHVFILTYENRRVFFFIYMYVYEKYTFQGPIESPVTSSYLFLFHQLTQQRIFSLMLYTIRLCYTNHLLLRLLSFSFFFFLKPRSFVDTYGRYWSWIIPVYTCVYLDVLFFFLFFIVHYCYIPSFFLFFSWECEWKTSHVFFVTQWIVINAWASRTLVKIVRRSEILTSSVSRLVSSSFNFFSSLDACIRMFREFA